MRVITVTPAGRRRYLAALVPHLLRQRHVIDEHHWWLNTNDAEDARYVRQVTAEHPEFFKICHKHVVSSLSIGHNIWRFFGEYSEPDTLYIRLDDDIVWFAHDAIENLVRFRLAHREAPVVLGNVVNNAVCTHALQQHGVVPKAWGEVENFCLDGNGWACPHFARKLHKLFLGDLEKGRTERWKKIDIHVKAGRRFSVNVISWLGDDMRQVPEVAGGSVDEELFLTVGLPRRLGRPNAACGDALFAHFAFFTQRPYLEWTWPELIGHYHQIADEQPLRQSLNEVGLTLLRHSAWQYGKHVRKLRASLRKRDERRKAA
jgi:hypothetical protein